MVKLFAFLGGTEILALMVLGVFGAMIFGVIKLVLHLVERDRRRREDSD